ncbi:MAG: TonB-dependent receptor [Xanthomonadaceae bacterium]|nr:TonB-dependent receptor [Xanthomonadaceae bacterium]
MNFNRPALFDLGPVTPAQMQAAPRPIPAFAEQTREAVDQWFAGLAYEGRWRDRAEASVGVSYSDYRKSTLVPGESIARATDRPLLWNGSVALNFSPDLAIYAGVARGLEESGVAPASAVNRNAALPAIETAQADAGVRWRVTQEMRFVAGVFEVRKPYFNLDERSVWRELGDVRNRGIELSLSGELREGLSAVAGAILLDSEVTGDAVTIGRVGRRPVGSTPRVLLLNMNWSPGVLPDTSFDIGVLHSGPIVASRNNVVHLPAYTSLDLGVRREIRFGPHPARIRVQATNVTDRDRFELQGAGAYGVAPGRLVTLSLSVDL